MKLSILKYAVPFALVLAMPNTADAASSSSSCLFFCGSSAKDAKTVPVQKAPVTPAAAETDLDSVILQAQTARKSGDFTGAARILSQLVLYAPDDGRVLGEYGKTLVAQGRSDDALAFLERAIQLQPSDWSLYSAQGVAYDQKGIYPSAQIAYARALALKPGDPTVLNNAALSHMQSGDLDLAERMLHQASTNGAEHAQITQNLALVQSLKAKRPVPVPAPEEKAVAAVVAPPAPAPVVAPPPAPPVVAVAPAPVPPPATVQVVAAPAPVQAAAPAIVSPTVERARLPAPSVSVSSLDTLKADPTVRMMQVPREEPQPAKAIAPKPFATAKPEIAEARFAATPTPAPIPKPIVQRAANGAYYVQAGSFNSEERAGKAALTLDSMGARVTSGTVDGHAVYRVRIGPFRDVRQANAAIDQAQSMGHADLKIVSE